MLNITIRKSKKSCISETKNKGIDRDTFIFRSLQAQLAFIIKELEYELVETEVFLEETMYTFALFNHGY